MPNIGSLTVELDLQTQKYEAGLKRSKQQIDQHSTSLNALQQDAIDAGRVMTSSSDAIVAAWGKSGEAAENAIRKMEQISRGSAVSGGIREMKAATDEIVNGWGKVGDSSQDALGKIEHSAADAGRSLKGIEQMLGIHIPKALDHLLSESKTLGPILAGALSGIAALQFLEILEKVYEQYKKITDAVNKWSDESKKAFADQSAGLVKLMDQLNEYASVLDKVRGVGLTGVAAPLHEQQSALDDIARQQQSIASLEQKRRVVLAELATLTKEIDTQLKLGGEITAKQNQEWDALTEQAKQLGENIDSAKDKLQPMLRDLPLVVAQTNKAAADAAAEATKKLTDAEKERQEKISQIRRQNEHALLQEEKQIQEQQSAYIAVLTKQYETQIEERAKGEKDLADHQEGNLQNAEDIIRKNQAKLLAYGDEIQKQMTANIGLITAVWIKSGDEANKAREAAKKLQDQMHEAGRALQSSLTRDFGTFLEHSTQEGADFWRSFERFGLNAIDAVANYADKLGLLGQGVSGLVGGLAKAAPFAPIAVGAIEFGRGLGQKIGQGRNEADIFGANVLKPFQDQVGAIIDLLQKSANAGTITTEALTQAQTNFETGWQNVLDAASKTQTDVGKQAVATLTPIVSRWREAIGSFADDAMAADQATAALSAQLQALSDQQKAVADETASLIDKIANPAGNLSAMEGALQNLTGVNKGQIIKAIGDDLLRIGDTLKAADRPIPPMIADLYQYAKAQQEAADATAKMVDINDQLAGIYNDLGPALNQQLDRLDQERASLQSQIIDAQNEAARSQLQDTLDNTSNLNEYIRAQADMRALDKKIKSDKAKADAEELQRLQDRLSEVTRLQDVSNDVLQQLGIARSSENDLLDSSITALLERGQALEDERRNLANVTGAAELASNAFGQLAAMLYPFTSQPAIKSYQAGTDFVPATGLYQLHQGEAVLTRDQNRNRGGDTHLNFYGPVVGDMNELADKISDRVLQNHQYDVQFGSKRPATRQRAARGNRW